MLNDFRAMERAALDVITGAPSIRAVEDIPAIETFSSGSIEWTVGGLIPAGGITLFTGEPGCGKTTLALGIAGHVAVGAPFAGMETGRRPVLILDRENPAAVIQERFKRLGLQSFEGLRVWGGWCSEEAVDASNPIVAEWVLRTEPKPLIVVDSLVAFARCDENSASEVRAYLHGLRLLTNTGASVLLLHHSGKSESASRYRGSSDIPAAVDIAAVISNLSSAPGSWDRVGIRSFKSRFESAGEILIEFDATDACFRNATGPTRAETNEAVLAGLLRRMAGCSRVQFESAALRIGVKRSRARAFLDSAAVAVAIGDRNRHSYRLADGTE